MAKLPRVTQKIFAQNSDTKDVTVFGTAKNGNDAVFTKDISQIMNSEAFSQGWGSATLTDDAPFQEDMNGVQLALSQQLAYFFENGMPEWNENTTYYANTSFCQVNGVWYQSLTDNNIGNNPVNDTTNWYKIDLDKLNPDLSNLSAPGLDKLNQSKALETGSVSSDADVYADVEKYAHSTFDLSKFTVVGSPNITGDGIASGFSTANYITTPSSFNFASAQSFEILLAITTPSNTASVTSYTGFFNTLSSDNTEFITVGYELENSRFAYGLGTTTGTFWNIYSSNTIQPDTKYYIKIKVDNTTVTIQISTNGTDWITDASGTISSPLNINNVLRFGLDRSLSRPFEGTIDLKSIAVWADGVPVFSGNKTGIDVIKPDNFEVVGTPTITEDGIASGFSTANYIPHGITINSSDDFEIIIPVKLNQLSNVQYIAHFIDASALRQEGNIIAFNLKSTEATQILPYFALVSNVQIDTKYYCKLKKVGNTYIAAYKTNDIDWVIVKNVTSNLTMFPITSLVLGNSADKERPLTAGEIDLNDIQVYINGNLVYQPCLKIPYTLSKTGSKIVDAAYRDRVQDMYEQYGYAPYYTIDEENENFTLPMGEIYGIIEQKKSNDGFSLFDTKLTDRILTGVEAVGWALQGALITMTYPDAVNKIKELYAGGTDTTFRGISCKKTTDGRYIADISQKTAIDNLFNTTGVADFYILDSTNSEFYLPRNNWFLQAGSDTGAVNNYNAPGLPGISGNIGKFDVYEGYASGCFTIKNTSYSDTREQWGGTVADIGFNASQSSSVYGASSSVQPPSSIKLLYYKVGNTVPNTGLIDIGHVLSDIQQLSKSYITETYINGSSWYRVWSDGWIEQGGRLQIQASTQASVNLMKPYSDTNYAAFSSHSLPGTGNQAESYIQQTSASVVSIGNSCGNEQTFTWMCAGK